MMREVSIIDQQQPFNMPASTSSNSPESNGGESSGEMIGGDNVEENGKWQSHTRYHPDTKLRFDR